MNEMKHIIDKKPANQSMDETASNLAHWEDVSVHFSANIGTIKTAWEFTTTSTSLDQKFVFSNQ